MQLVLWKYIYVKYSYLACSVLDCASYLWCLLPVEVKSRNFICMDLKLAVKILGMQIETGDVYIINLRGVLPYRKVKVQRFSVPAIAYLFHIFFLKLIPY